MIIAGVDLQRVNIRETFENFRREWPDRTPKQKWQVMCDIPGTLLQIFGIRILSDCRIYWLSFFGSFLALNYFGLATYTLIYYARVGRFIYGTRCVCGVGIVASSITLYVKCLTSDRYRLRFLFRYSGDHVYKDVKDSSPFTELCEECIEKMRKSYLILVVVIFISIGSISVGPIDAYLRKGVKITPFGTKTPFFEENSDIGFTVDMVYQSCMMPFGIVSTICIELCQCMTYNTVELCSSAISLAADLLSKNIEKEKTYSIKSRAYFRNIMMQIQDYDMYLLEFADVFYWKTFLGPPLLTFGTTYGIFSQWVVREFRNQFILRSVTNLPLMFIQLCSVACLMDFPAGYGNAIVSYIALLVLCYMGQNIDSANEGICDALTDMTWYNLPLSHQKDIAHALNRMQNGVVLTQRMNASPEQTTFKLNVKPIDSIPPKHIT